MSNVWEGPGKALYESHRKAYNTRADRNGWRRLARWKCLRPRTMELWNETARLYREHA